jgi:transposase
MSTPTTRLDWREGQRRRAWERKEQGWKPSASAAALGVTPGAVSQWLKRAREQGVEALRRHPAPGPQPKLSAERRAHIPALLERGAEAYGFRGQVWTCQRVAEVMRRPFGVMHGPSGPRQPAAAGPAAQRPASSVQRPAPRHAGHPTQRGRDCRLVAGALARPGKKAADEGRTLVWVDQSGCSLLPRAVRTWAPRGRRRRRPCCRCR